MDLGEQVGDEGVVPRRGETGGTVVERHDERVGGRDRGDPGRVAGREVVAQGVAERTERTGTTGVEVVDPVEAVVGVEQGADTLERPGGDARLGAERDPLEERVGAGDLADGVLPGS